MNVRRPAIVIGGAIVVALAAVVAVVANDERADSVTITASGHGSGMPAAIASTHAKWTMILDQRFDGAELGSEWTTCYWWQIDGGCTIASNDELQWYQPEGVRVTDGTLRLQAAAEPQVTPEGHTLPYRSGMASTGPTTHRESDAGFVFTYGYVEAVVRFPTGAGTWSAVWLLSADLTSTPEIDIVEHYGGESVVKSRVHQRVDGVKLSEGIETRLVPTADGWHRVGVLWTQQRVEFYFDDVLTGVVDDNSLVPATPMYLIVNLAMGGAAGLVDEQALPQYFDIDRIRVWQEEST